MERPATFSDLLCNGPDLYPREVNDLFAYSQELESENARLQQELANAPRVDGEGAAEAERSEKVCNRCGGPNTMWAAPSPLWNAVMRGGSIDGPWQSGEIICPMCFMEMAETQGIADIWRVDAVQVNVELETVTPSGRVWNPETWLWDGSPLDNGPSKSEMGEALIRIEGALRSEEPQWARLGDIADIVLPLAKRIEEAHKPVEVEGVNYGCTTCGAGVFDKELHLQWHRESIKDKL